MQSGLMNFSLSCKDVVQNIYMHFDSLDIFDVPYVATKGFGNHVYWTFTRPHDSIIGATSGDTTPLWVNIYYSTNISNSPNVIEFVYTPLKDFASFNINTAKRSYFDVPSNIVFDTIYTTKDYFKIDPQDVLNNNIFAIGVSASGQDTALGIARIHGISIWYSGIVGKFENSIV